MGRVAAAIAAALVVTGLLVGAGAGAADHRAPQIRVTASNPMTVHGTHFRRREHVRVTVRSTPSTTVVRRLRTSRAGTFTTTFPGVQTGHCGPGFTVTVTGSKGSQATLTHRPRPPLPACMTS
jgi:hypothetical protein